MDSFPIEIHDKLGWYVYRLIDPRNGQTFYVGKGWGDRVFQHIRGALKQEDALDEMDLKTKTILDIQRANLPVLHVIHRHGLENSEVAYEVEAALMDAYYGLTNISGGHGSLERGCRHVDQIVSAYRAAPLEPKEPLILIFIGRALDEGRDIYQAVREVPGRCHARKPSGARWCLPMMACSLLGPTDLNNGYLLRNPIFLFCTRTFLVG